MLKEYINKIGQECYINIDNLKIKCKILDVKNAYGNIRYLLTPIKGNGKTWKNEYNVKFSKKQKIKQLFN